VANLYTDIAEGALATPALWNDRFNALRKGDVFNVKSYGAVGDGTTNDATAIQLAVTAAAVSGGTVLFPPATYKVNSQLTGAANVRLLGYGATIDFSAFADATAFFKVEGTDGTATTLSGNAAEGDTSVSVTSVSGFSAGGYARLGSTATTGSISIPKGEVVRVDTVGASSLTLEDPACDAYATADSANIVPLTLVSGVVVEGLRFLGGSDTTISYVALQLDRCYNPRVLNCRFERCHYAGIYMQECISGTVAGNHFKDSEKSGLAYGIAILNACQDITITGNTGVNCRHVVTIGGSTGRRGVARRVTVTGNTASQCTEAGFDCHPGAEDIAFIGNTVLGSLVDGIQMHGSRFTIANNVVIGSTRHGIQVQHLSTRALAGSVTGNTVKRCGSIGIVLIPNSTYQGYTGLSISANTVESVTSYAISCENASYATYYVKGLVVQGNACSADTADGIYLRGVQEGVIAGNRVVLAGQAKEAIYLLNCDDIAVNGNATYNSTSAGIRVNTSTNCSVSGNRVKGHTTGIYFNSTADYCTATGNTVSGATNGIYWLSSSHGAASGNIVNGSGSAGNGIRVTTGTDVAITGNRVRNHSVGVLLSNDAEYCTVMGNGLRTNSTPLTVGSGTGHVTTTADVAGAYNRT
jgi:parallel beta-helix repeat protein